MFTMHEALARERMREREQQSRSRQLASELAAARRWHYLERRARAAHQRHASRAHRAALVTAIID
jgi:hypothetical protein